MDSERELVLKKAKAVPSAIEGVTTAFFLGCSWHNLHRILKGSDNSL